MNDASLKGNPSASLVILQLAFSCISAIFSESIDAAYSLKAASLQIRQLVSSPDKSATISRSFCSVRGPLLFRFPFTCEQVTTSRARPVAAFAYWSIIPLIFRTSRLKLRTTQLPLHILVVFRSPRVISALIRAWNL